MPNTATVRERRLREVRPMLTPPAHGTMVPSRHDERSRIRSFARFTELEDGHMTAPTSSHKPRNNPCQQGAVHT